MVASASIAALGGSAWRDAPRGISTGTGRGHTRSRRRGPLGPGLWVQAAGPVAAASGPAAGAVRVLEL
eukprot:7024618-Alexandrium_andersonii.AAC.1